MNPNPERKHIFTQNSTCGREAKLRIPHSKISFFPSAIRLWNIIPPHALAADPIPRL